MCTKNNNKKENDDIYLGRVDDDVNLMTELTR